MTRAKRLRSGESGAALVEFGLLLPVFLGIILGLVTGGLAFFARLQVTTAAQEGARVMYMGGTASAAQSAANAATTGTVVVTADGSPVGTSWSCSAAGNSGKTVAVTVTRPNMFIRWIAADTTVTVEGRGVTRCA